MFWLGFVVGFFSFPILATIAVVVWVIVAAFRHAKNMDATSVKAVDSEWRQ
jgi:hypothetical protein